MQDIPQVLVDIPPEKFRELIEALLGGPLQEQSSSIRREVIDSPTDEHKAQPHIELADGKIMLFRHCAELQFRTAWHPTDELRRHHDLSMVRMMYMGAATDSRFLHEGSEVKCMDKWSELRSSTQCKGTTAPTWTAPRNWVKLGWKIIAIRKLIELFMDE